MHKDRIGVIIPFYGSKQKLFRTLESVYQQTLAPDYVVLIDDCGPDPLNELDLNLWKHKLPSLVFLQNEKNLGAGLTRNMGMDFLNGKVEFLQFLDSDDCVGERFYAVLKQKLKVATDAIGAYCLTKNHLGYFRDSSCKKQSLYDGFFGPRPWATCSFVWRFERIIEVKWVQLKSSEDTIFELGVAKNHESILGVTETYVTVYQDFDDQCIYERNKANEEMRLYNKQLLYEYALKNIPIKQWLQIDRLKLFARDVLDKQHFECLAMAVKPHGFNLLRIALGVYVYVFVVLLKHRLERAL